MSTPLAYSKSDAAEAAGVSVQTLDRAIRAGVLRAKKTSITKDGEPSGKIVILASDLNAWLEALVDA